MKNNDLLFYEKELWFRDTKLIAGVDEVGRGCVAGPVVACAVILPSDETLLEKLSEVNDSKKLSEEKREQLFPLIQEVALTYGVGIISHEVIDQVNILQATFMAMREALSKLTIQPEIIFVDGNKAIPTVDIQQTTIVKGDSKSLSIASASIIAKVIRDRIMVEYANEFDNYFFKTNKGYGTKEHVEAIKKFGLSSIHRKTFCKNFFVEQLELF